MLEEDYKIQKFEKEPGIYEEWTLKINKKSGFHLVYFEGKAIFYLSSLIKKGEKKATKLS